jgi:ribosome-associated translation inhibitor RaiA
MKIQVNTDKNVSGSDELRVSITSQLTDDLDRFNDLITRLEVHLSDEDGKKDGQNDKRCLLEARLENRQPIVVTNNANNHDEAVRGAVDKLKAKLTTIVGRLRKY